MESKCFFASVCVLVGLMAPLPAQDKPEPTLTLRRCVEIALERNPLLLSSQGLYEASLARVQQARELSPPALSYDSDLQPGPFDFGKTRETYLGINQTLELPGRRILRGRIAARESDQAGADVEILKLDLAFQVKQAFYGLLLAGEKIQYAAQDLELAEDFLAKAEAQLAAGDTAEVEALRARVEAAKAANGLRIARNEEALAAAGLNYLLARRPREPLRLAEEAARSDLDFDPERLKGWAMEARPEMRRIRAAEEGEALKIKQARLSQLPDFDLGLAQHKIGGEAASWDFTLSFSLPLFFWQPKRGAVAESEASARALRREAEDLRNQIERDVEEAAMNAASARDQIRLFEDRILKPAEEVYQAFLYRFQAGEIGGIELIEARRSLLEARRSYADARLNYHVTVASLERAIARSLEGAPHEK
ncbi:MAG: TolC family protein [Acidobacteriota bacterium]|nr:TolC family protein [Acidobacteriota bacterium]